MFVGTTGLVLSGFQLNRHSSVFPTPLESNAFKVLVTARTFAFQRYISFISSFFVAPPLR